MFTLHNAEKNLIYSVFTPEQNQPKTLQQLARIRQAQLDAAASRPLASKGTSDTDQPIYPNVYSSHSGGNVLSSFGQKFSLPPGTTKASYDVSDEPVAALLLPFHSYIFLQLLEI